MKVAVCLFDSHHHGMDFSSPHLGNTGIGGSDYDVLMLSYALANFSDVKVTVYHEQESNKLMDGVTCRIFHDYKELLRLVKADENDILVMNYGITDYDPEIKYVVWVHNYLPYESFDLLSASDAVKRVVFVGREHYDHYIDHKIIRKSVPIFNMYDGRPLKLRDFPVEPAVTYTGGLYQVKGFHILASMWKDILREVPDAKLYVVGSGKLYNENAELGSLGVADREYEEMFAQYLMEDGKLLPSVNFCGTLGREKSEIYYKTTVGVMNPSGNSETLGMSALDMEACGVPVVTRAVNGQFDSVRHGVTGFLGKDEKEIKKYIIRLLKDKELNLKLGRQAKEFVESTFLPENLVKQWLKVFDDIMEGRSAEYIRPSGNYSNNMKWFKAVIHWLMVHNIPVMPIVPAWGKIKEPFKKHMPILFYALKKFFRRT